MLWRFVVLFLWGLPRAKAHRCNEKRLGAFLCQETSDYIVIVDAGSTGTRAHVFHYEPRKQKADTFPYIVEKPLTAVKSLGAFDTTPGISSFVHNTSGLAGSLRPILQKAAGSLRAQKLEVEFDNIPLYLGATAGMRVLHTEDRDRVMAAVRDFLAGPECPFAFRRKEQARTIAGEEEGAFGWLTVNALKGTLSSDPLTTWGSLDMGGASAQVTFIPEATSILANFFPMHFGAFRDGPIHLYTHSFLEYGYVRAYQRGSSAIYRAGRTRLAMEHPCLPRDLTWRVDEGDFGVSTASLDPRRKDGPIEIRGTGNFSQCQKVARALIVQAPCFQPPCSFAGVYQPGLRGSRFALLGEYASALTALGVDISSPGPLSALNSKLERFCSLSQSEQALWREGFGSNDKKAPLICWLGTWCLTFLVDGLGFPLNSNNVAVHSNALDWPLGQAIYETNFFPYRVDKLHESSKHAALEVAALPAGFSPDAAPVSVILASIAFGAFLAHVAPRAVVAASARWNGCRYILGGALRQPLRDDILDSDN